MRAVLRTLAQCHARRILHRDIKVALTAACCSPLSCRSCSERDHCCMQAQNFLLLNDTKTRYPLRPQILPLGCCMQPWPSLTLA